MRARLLLLVLGLFGLLASVAGCTSTGAAPQSASPTTLGASARTIGAAAASSASGPGSLAQLLSTPRPVPSTTPPTVPGEPPPPPPEPYKTGPRAASPVITPPPSLGPGDGTVYAVGDSVLLGARDYLYQTVGGWDLRFDAEVGRRFPEGIDLIRQNRKSIGQAVIVLLGHNYGGGGYVYSYLDEIMSMLRDTPRVVFVTVKEWNPAIPEVNRAIRALPSVYGNVVVADWSAVVDANPQFLVDNVHLNSSGSIALANLIAVMLGPANKNGTKVPPIKILKVPDSPDAPKSTTTLTTAPPGTTPSSSTTTTTTVETTTTSTPASTTTAPVTTTTAPATTTTVKNAGPP